MDNNKLNMPVRRLVNPADSEVVVVPQVDRLIADAMCIIGAELAHYRSKARKGMNLTAQESRVIRDYVDALVKLSKEAREAAKSNDLSDLSNEELLELAQKLAGPQITE